MGTAAAPGRTFSVEFFPPKTDEGADKLRIVRRELAELAPAYASVTFGAGGSTRAGTLETVRAILAEGAYPAAPHVSCIASSKAEIQELLDSYRALGVARLVALRGDVPSGSGGERGDFSHADELVAFIRATTGDRFLIEVAAYPEMHPQARSADVDLANFARKVAAGADGAITQYFYNPDAYFRFVEDATRLGVDVPIVPGVMPITNYTQLARFSDACGAEIPRWIRRRLAGFGEDMQALRDFGVEVTLKLCTILLQGGAPGIHFYTMNRTEPTRRIWQALGLGGKPAV